MTNAAKAALFVGVLAAIVAPVLQLSLQSSSPVAGALAYLLVLTLSGIVLWIGFRLTQSEFGWRFGAIADYGVGLIYPLLVMTVLVGIAAAHGQTAAFEAIDWGSALTNLAIMTGATIVAVIITEEGFFRGALWGVAVRANWGPWAILIWTTICFVAWHGAVPFIDPNYQIPADALPIYFVNATLISLAFGILRLGSGSILIASVAHGVWNGLAYVLFGYGADAGVLGVTEFSIYGPERGLFGIAVNSAALLALLSWVRNKGGFATSG